jgi:LysM repeat protein
LSALVVLLMVNTAFAQDATNPNVTCVPQKPDGWTTYTIQEGDTLSSIALRTGTTVQELLSVNCITNRGMIVVGATIFVPRAPVDDNAIAERCRLAGIEPERCRHLFGRDHDTAALRCRNAGLTPERCRALLNGDDNNIAERCRLAGIEPERCRELFGNDDDAIVERCRLAGIEPERCRAILFGEDNHLAERCRLAGIEPERCRELASGDDNNIAERCRLAGIEPERCRELYNDATGDGNNDAPPVAEVRPATPVAPTPESSGRGGRG